MTPGNMPYISCVIPTHNSALYICNTLETVFRQTYENYEVIISDDGSADNTLDVIRAFVIEKKKNNLRIVENKHSGPGAARNKGIMAAKGEWISFLDSDDEWYPEKLAHVAGLIASHPDAWFYCHAEMHRDGGNELFVDYSKRFDFAIHPFLSLYRNNALSTSAVTVRKDMLITAGLFDEHLPSAQDYDMWLRLSLLKGFKIFYIHEPLGTYIVRKGSISFGIAKHLRCKKMVGVKYLKSLEQIVRFPLLERMRYYGTIYAAAGLGFIRGGDLIKGTCYLLWGILLWPFRPDWVKKCTNRT